MIPSSINFLPVEFINEWTDDLNFIAYRNKDSNITLGNTYLILN